MSRIQDSEFKIKFRTGIFNQYLRAVLLLIVLTLTFGAQIQLSRPKTEKPLPNPYMLGAPRDETLAATKQMLETREIPIDKEDCNQLTGECTLISKPVIFIKGITTRSQLEHYCEVPTA